MRDTFKVAATVVLAAIVTLVLTGHAVSASERRTAETPVSLASAGTDVLVTDYGVVPVELWDALRRDGHAGVIEQPTNIDRLYVPVGTVVSVPGGLYLATADGWYACADFKTFNGECSGTGPVVSIGHGPVSDFWMSPPFSPSGASITHVSTDDGSVEYSDGLMFDPEQRMFRIFASIYTCGGDAECEAINPGVNGYGVG